MARRGQRETERRRAFAAVAVVALLLQALLFGPVRPKPAPEASAVPAAAHAAHGGHAAGHHPGDDAPDGPAGDQGGASSLCALLCALRALAGGPALLPPVASVPEPDAAAERPIPPAPSVARRFRPLLPVGARGPPSPA